MQFLVLFGIVLLFSWKFPSIFKAAYWLFMLPLYTIGPACFIYLGSMIAGADWSFLSCCIIALVTCAIPFMAWTAPK